MHLRNVKHGWKHAFAVCVLLAHWSMETLADPQFDAAERNYRAGRYAQAAKLYRELAEAGLPQAQLRLGMLHYLGRGVKEDERQAFDWVERAARAGDLEAQYRLATLYTLRHGVPPSVEDPDIEAARWYFAAAARGHAESQYALALMFITGKGVAQSQEEADKWMRRAAAQGFEPARGFAVSKPAASLPRK